MDRLTEQTRELIVGTLGHVPMADLARPVPGHWSPAQIIEHLRLCFAFTAKGIERCLEDGDARPQAPSPAQRLAKWAVIVTGYFPTVETPAVVRPGGAPPPVTIVDDVLRALDAMDAALARAERERGADVPLLDHPQLAAMSPAEWRRFHLLHTRRHMRQAKARLGRRA